MVRKLEAGEVKARVITVRLSDAEYAAVKSIAAQKQMQVADLVTHALFNTYGEEIVNRVKRVLK